MRHIWNYETNSKNRINVMFNPDSALEKNVDFAYLRVSGSNRGYKTSAILESFITGFWYGANPFLYTEVTRHDAALGKIFELI